jgi:hypothetical protein
MRGTVRLIAVLFLAGCQPETKPVLEVEPVEPGGFSAWPKVTDGPVQVGPGLWGLCREPTPEEARTRVASARSQGPHAGYSIVVRVSPDALAPFLGGKPLPTGAIVVKEKYADRLASGPMYGYALMVKRDAGYDPGGGDWEYAYVALVPERKVARGRIAECAGCHASARERDFLFRTYGDAGP